MAGVSRQAPDPVAASTSHTGHSAGRLMPEPPESKGDEPSPAGTALAPPAAVTRQASFERARFGLLVPEVGHLSIEIRRALGVVVQFHLAESATIA
jgi:hypothetical protein